jgi:hypothetical protein
MPTKEASMAISKPSKCAARSPKGPSASSLSSDLFKQSVEFSAAMLSLVILSRRSEAPPGRSKPRLEREKQLSYAKRKAVNALLRGQAGGIDEALLAKLLVLGQHAMQVGMTYETIGAPEIRHQHPVGFVAGVLREAK